MIDKFIRRDIIDILIGTKKSCGQFVDNYQRLTYFPSYISLFRELKQSASDEKHSW